MITKCELRNFKGFRSLDLDLGLVNVFIGANGSGKSSVGQALLLLKQSQGSVLTLQGPYFRAASLTEVQRIGEESSMLTIGFSASIQAPDLGVSQDFMKDLVTLKATFDFERGNLRRSTTEIGLTGGTVSAQWDRYEGASRGDFDIASVRFSYSGTANIGSPVQVTGVSPIGSVPPDRLEWTSAQFHTLIRAVPVVLARLYYVPPIRGFENPSLTLLGSSMVDLLEGGSQNYPLAVLATLAYQRREYQPRIASWTERVVNRRVLAEVIPGPQVEARGAEADREINILGEGFGLNQLTFLFTQILTALPSSTIIVEEPEIHLHPKAQYELGALLVEVALQERTQFVFTTHSEHFLFGVLSKIRSKNAFTSKDLRVYSFERKDAVASAQALTVSADGKVRGGLPGFFEVNLLELQEALSKSKE